MYEYRTAVSYSEISPACIVIGSTIVVNKAPDNI